MNSIRMFRRAMLLTGFLVLLGAIGAEGQANPNPDLVSKLTQQLNITPQQATGGAGAIFGLAKSRLSPADFSKIASAVPGMDGFLKAAPATGAPAAGAPATSASSALGSLGSMAPGGLGGLSSLAGSFQSLKLSPATASQFVPVLENYISSKGGANVASLFTGALK